MTSDVGNNLISLPRRIFAVGEEPVGVRVTPYHKPCGLMRIFKALDAEEVDFICKSQFGKLVDIADLPSFSGRFGRYVISRQLKVKKKHESWFLFSGKPIRFSIREFALVTGLNCSKLPANSRKRATRTINDKPDWGELFGTLKDVPVSNVIRMLEKRTVTERDTRIKYACLALLASVILPTTHTHRISHDHTEMMKDIQEFLDYPWGRVAFELLISSIKERNEIALSQNTIALKGFVLSLQLVMIEAVPALTEVVRDGSSSGSECDYGDDEEYVDGVRRGVSPSHARDVDNGAKAQVVSILGGANPSDASDSEHEWSDEEEDAEVDNMMGLIKMGHEFTNSLFVGGLSTADVTKMREEASVVAVVRKTQKKKKKTPTPIADNIDPDYIVSLVKETMKEDVNRLEGELGRLNDSVALFQSRVAASVTQMFGNMKAEIATTTREAIRTALGSVSSNAPLTSQQNPPNSGNCSVDANGTSVEEEDSDDIINAAMNYGVQASVLIDRVDNNVVIGADPPIVTGADTLVNNQETQYAVDGANESGPFVEDPTFSLGLSQEETRVEPTTHVDDVIPSSDVNPGIVTAEDDFDVPLQAFRKSKRARLVPKALVGEYACDVRLLNQARVSQFGVKTGCGDIDYSVKYSNLLEKLDSHLEINVGDSRIGTKEITQIGDMKSQLTAKLVDTLMHHTRSLYQSQSSTATAIFLDTKFVSQLGRCSAKFSRTGKKESFTFPANVCAQVSSDSVAAGALRYYFPFNLDKTHWVGICADTASWSLVVLDCNLALRSDALMAKELRNVATMFFFLLRQAGKVGGGKDTKPMNVDRPRSVPQNLERPESAVTAVLLIQAHAVAGIEVCKCITPNVLLNEVKRLLVMMYEENVGSL